MKADFAYDADADVYRCPAGETLRRHYTTEEQGLVVHRYWINLCQTCEIKARYTTGKERRITPSHRCKQRLPGSGWEHAHLVDEMRERMSRDPTLMALRRSTVEHPFGTIKAWMGATHFQTRTLPRVSTEMSLHVLAYNLRRVINILGVKPLIAAIRKVQSQSTSNPCSM